MKKIVKMFSAILAIACVFGLFSCKKTDNTEETKPYNALGNFVVGDETNVYSFATNTEEALDFDYTKTEDESHRNAYLKKTIDSKVKLEEYKKLVIAVSGMGDVTIELVAGSTTLAVSLNVTGVEASYEWNLMPHTSTLKNVTEIRVSSGAGRVSTNGQVLISKMSFELEVAENFIIATGFNNIPSNINEYNGVDETFDFNAKWANNGEDDVYEIEQNPETKAVTVDYKKEAGDEWACIISQVRGKMAKFNYVVVVAQGTAGKKLLVKVEGLAAKETNETFDGTKQTFVLDISTFTEEQKNGIAKVVLFGSPNAVQDGRFTIYEAYMSETSPIEVEEIKKNVYDGTSEEFKLDYWYDGSDKVYTTEKVNDGLKVTFSSKGEWATLKAYIEGKISNFKFLVVEVSSTTNSSILLKAANGCESSITQLSSEHSVVYVNIQSVQNLDSLSEVIIFGNPGSTGAGEFTIHNAYFANEVKGVELPTTNVYDKFYEAFDVNHYWVDNNTGTYTVTEEGTKTVVQYVKGAGTAWATVKTTLEGVTDEFSALKLVVKGVAGSQILVKPNDDGSCQKWVEMTAEEQTIYAKIPNNMTVIHIFCEPGKETGETGTLEILEAKLVRDVVVNDETSVDLVNHLFTSEPNIYQIENAANGVTINYTKPAGNWSTVKAFVAGENSEFKTLTLTFKGVAGTRILVKPNDAMEIWIDVTGEEQVEVIKNLPSPFFSFIMFIAPNTTSEVSGSFVLKSAVLSKAEAPVDTTPVEGTYADKSNNGFYTITTSEGVTTVDYNVSMAGWFFFELTLTTSVENVNKLYMTFTSTSDVNILVKVNDDNNLQSRFDVSSEAYTLEQAINGTLTRVLVFISPEVAGATGTMTIANVGYTVVEGPVTNEYTGGSTFDVNRNWFDGGDGVYTVNVAGTDTEVDFAKGAFEWASVKVLISGLNSEFNYLVINVAGTEGLELLVKSVGKTAHEERITIGAEVKTYYIPVVNGMTELLIFGAPGSKNVEGSFVIKSAVLTRLADAEGNLAAKMASGNDIFAVTEVEEITTIAYTNKGAYDSIYVSLLPVDMSGKAIEVSFESTMVEKVLVKLNNNNTYESTLTLTDGKATLKITKLPEQLTEVRVFVDFEKGVTSGELTADIKVVENTEVVQLTWNAVDGGDSVFTISTAETGLYDVVFAKENNNYAHMKVLPNITVKGTKVVLTLSSAEGIKITIKPNDTKETTITLTETATAYTIEMGAEVSFATIIIMVEIEQASATGSFTIHSISIE